LTDQLLPKIDAVVKNEQFGVCVGAYLIKQNSAKISKFVKVTAHVFFSSFKPKEKNCFDRQSPVESVP
jgi:hypothetical protein